MRPDLGAAICPEENTNRIPGCPIVNSAAPWSAYDQSVAIRTVRSLSACAVAVVLGAVPLAAVDLEQYRSFRLGSSTAAVMTVAGTASPRDLKTVLMRPALLQELEWRPPFKPDRVAPKADPVRRVVFSFIDDQLLKIVVEYERSRTEGLTRDDMIEVLSAAYGAHDRLPVPGGERSGDDALDAAAVIARWRSAEATVTLQRYDFVGGYALVVTSVRLGARARQAQAAGAALDLREAPERDAALLRVRADAAREASQKTRSANKASFIP